MWFYDNLSREEFEQRKDYIEQILCECGASALTIELPYEQKTTSCSGDFQETYYSHRPVFQFHHDYFRINELLSDQKPFIVIECGTYDELMQNIMEDAELLPCDLSDKELKNKIKCLLK